MRTMLEDLQGFIHLEAKTVAALLATEKESDEITMVYICV